MSGEPLGQLCDQLNPEACRLANLPDRIWVFGGPGQFRLTSQEPCESLREAFFRQTFLLPPSPSRPWIKDLDRPENHEGWWAFSGYSDLLTFERDSCHLARAIVLFPESPGSLAELGALAVDDAIIDRLLVVVQSKYLDPNRRQSFLTLGPLQRAESRNLRCVIGGASRTTLPIDDFESILSFLDERLPRVQRTEKLRIENPTHKLLLIADLVDLLLIVRPPELLAALNHFGLSMALSDLDRATKLLAFFEMLRIEHRGTEHFFVRQERLGDTWVNYMARDGKPTFDRSRFKLDRIKFLEGDRRKMSVLERSA